MTDSTPARLQGKIKFYHIPKGYGFIIPVDADTTKTTDTAERGIFVHRSAVFNTKLAYPFKGEVVEYEVVQDETGRSKASNVARPNARPYIKKKRNHKKTKAVKTVKADGDDTKNTEVEGEGEDKKTQRRSPRGNRRRNPRGNRRYNRRGPKSDDKSADEAVSTEKAAEGVVAKE